MIAAAAAGLGRNAKVCKACSDSFQKGKTALMVASEHGDHELVRALLDKGADVNAKTPYGSSALMCASSRKVVRALLDKGADITTRTEMGDTALTEASRRGLSEVVQVLLENGADVNAKNEHGWTALITAARLGHLQIVRALLAMGADISANDEHGETALSWSPGGDYGDAILALLWQAKLARERGQRTLKSPTLASAPQTVKIFEKAADGTFTESQGDNTLAPVLFAQAEHLYNKVMKAAKSNTIMPDDERDVAACIGFLTKLIEVHPTRSSGVPNGMRAAMYFISAQITRSRDQLERAKSDYIAAIQMGDSDPKNLANWHESLDQIETVRGMIP
ncbi:MAG: ankyrin repeat domain-containing protein [Roseiarcus sp.]